MGDILQIGDVIKLPSGEHRRIGVEVTSSDHEEAPPLKVKLSMVFTLSELRLMRRALDQLKVHKPGSLAKKNGLLWRFNHEIDHLEESECEEEAD